MPGILWFAKGVTFAVAFGRSSLQVPVKTRVWGKNRGLTVSVSEDVVLNNRKRRK
jgi:hypothetical protein